MSRVSLANATGANAQVVEDADEEPVDEERREAQLGLELAKRDRELARGRRRGADYVARNVGRVEPGRDGEAHFVPARASEREEEEEEGGRVVA